MNDLSFVREVVRPLYAGSGRRSIDLVVLLKLQLVFLFEEDLRCERRLMVAVAGCLSLRWYVGYDLDEPMPDHSSLTRIREPYGSWVFWRIFERIVEMCAEAGPSAGTDGSGLVPHRLLRASSAKLVVVASRWSDSLQA